MKKMTVIQPSYFPNIQTLCQIEAADVIVWAESFLYKKQATINRTLIKTVAGAQWLTIPVLTKGKEQQRLMDVQIDPHHHWKSNHLKSIAVSYQNSPYYFFLADELKKLIKQEWMALNDVLFQTTVFLCANIRLKKTFLKSSDLPDVQNRSERVVAWLEASGCGNYLIPQHEAKFVEPHVIEKYNYHVTTMTFSPLRYHQLFSEFVENASGLDLLFNQGEQSHYILSQCNAGAGLQ